MIFNLLTKDLISGLCLIILGNLAISESLQHELGTLSHMGSGFFPMVLGILLILLGTLLCFFQDSSTEKISPNTVLDHCPEPDWRGISCIVLGILSFIAIGQLFGLIPATLLCVYFAARGDRTCTNTEALVLSIIMCVIAVFFFHLVMHVQFTLFKLPF
jgi:Tripartite tricarboxylate transporter TctB family